jgi:hypothetical protein
LTDIEKEMRYYRKHFKEKTVLCNCDDPFESNFFKYFVLNFNRLDKEKGGEEASAMEIEDLEIFENVAYIMAFHADPAIPKTIDEWLEQFEMFSIYEILPEILELWGTNLITDVEAKKNLKKAAGR